MHRRGYQGRKLGRERDPRRALLRGLATSVILHEHVTTTEAKAKEVRRVVDGLITEARRGDLPARRRVQSYLLSDLAVRKLFEETREVYRDRPSGFTRLVRFGHRKGDGAPLVRIELVEYEPLRKKEGAPAQASAEKEAPSDGKTEATKAAGRGASKPTEKKQKQESGAKQS